MLELQLSSNVSRFVQPSPMRTGDIALGLDRPDDRDGKRVRTTPPGIPKYTAPPAGVPFVEMERPATAWWWMALAFFMEGFAVSGALLYPSAAFSVDEASVAANAHQAHLAGNRQLAMAHEQGVSQPLNGSNVIAPGLAAWTEQRLRDRGDWLVGLGEKVVALWTHWRREQEIRRAVRALAEYDDRTLWDLGIKGRADIERMVRYCRDC
jgi:uncharacterized protein YjiS (DUF1127 family)